MILNITIKRICRNSGIHPLLLDFVFISYRSLVTSFELYLTRFIGITIHLRWYYDVYGTKAQIVSKNIFLMFHNHEISWIESRAAGFPSSCLFVDMGDGERVFCSEGSRHSTLNAYSWMTRENEPLNICKSLLCRQDHASLNIFATMLH